MGTAFPRIFLDITLYIDIRLFRQINVLNKHLYLLAVGIHGSSHERDINLNYS